MKAIRIGNDIVVRWLIFKNGEPADLSSTAADISVILSCRGEERRINDYVIDGNCIVFTFYGRDQKRPGIYRLTFVENEGLENMHTVDFCDAFALTESSCNNEGCQCENISVESIDITSELSAPSNGLSAYELALQYGFSGTAEEWLASLKGAQGDKGKSGNINYPTFEINDAMELVMDTEAVSNEDRFTIEDGHLILDLF